MSGGDAGTIKDGAAPGSVFPFSGPSCPATCGQCIQASCASEAQCLVPSCTEYYNCLCACSQGDLQCALGCVQQKLTPACIACEQTANACLNAHCSDCSGDAGASTPDDSGLGSDSGACQQLDACCLQLPSSEQLGCEDVVVHHPAQCQQALAGYQEGGMCQ
jgi:hypothetical protein